MGGADKPRDRLHVSFWGKISMSLLVSLLLLAVLPSLGSAQASCKFSIPATNATGSCDVYDLSEIAQAMPTYADVNYSYVFSLCQNVATASIPSPCKNVSGAVAYQYVVKTPACYRLGSVDSVYVFPYDPSDSRRGIRIVYDNGDGGNSANYPRSVIYDFICTPPEEYGRDLDDNYHTTLMEFPTYTYTVTMMSGKFCPVSRGAGSCSVPKFNATWRSVRFRPRPKWYDNAKFGIFLHWGLFSVPAFKTEWYWKQLESGNKEFVEFHNRVYGCSGVMPDKYPCTGFEFKYADFAPMFKAEMFDPDQWASIFKKAGAQYVVLTSKHHEGWCNFRGSYHWNWNSVDAGPKMDLVGNLTASVRAAGLHMGLYHSLREWYNPLYLEDNANNCSDPKFPDEVLLPTLMEIVNQYQPEVLWADGAGDAPCTHDSVNYWKAPEFLSWVYNESPVKDTLVANSRWGSGAIGDYQTGGDRFSPGHIIPYKWESCYTIQHGSWGYDRTEQIDMFYNTTELLYQLVSTVSCNGNLLLNVGPTADGRILPSFEQRLLEMGEWLEVNGEAIYNTVPWKVQYDTDEKLIWYTKANQLSRNIVYAITFKLPTPGEEFALLQLKPNSNTQVSLLGYSQPNQTLPFRYEAGAGLMIQVPNVTYGVLEHAWTFRLIFVDVP